MNAAEEPSAVVSASPQFSVGSEVALCEDIRSIPTSASAQLSPLGWAEQNISPTDLPGVPADRDLTVVAR